MELSIVIISFNTRELLRECLATAKREAAGLAYEIFVVDNASRDRSAEMVEAEFPEVRLIASAENLGFAAANNVAIRHASGKYVVLLNSDAFPHPGALRKMFDHLEGDESIGIAGGRLIGRDGEVQPSARMFPTILRDMLILSGLSAKFPKSRFFGQPDRTWSDLNQPAPVDWVPGAFFVARLSALDKVGLLDEGFFFYYEEVDLCKRIKSAGYTVWYFPDVEVLHLGGESAGAVSNLHFSSSGKQLTLWRMRSGLIYYRKHHGAAAWLAGLLEIVWHGLRVGRNSLTRRPVRSSKIEQSKITIALMMQAWRETSGGRLSPKRPW